MTANDADLERLIASLDLEQKVRLITGASMWASQPEPSIGLEPMVFSDGPAGVRGGTWDERDPSASLPSPTAMAASWDAGLIERLGALVASEARNKGVDVVLGPTINMQRTPRGGRHFEAFSEDPWLTGVMGSAYVNGVQAQGVGTSPKHFVANDSETDRHTLDVEVDERTLREIYLAPFEHLVAEARPWLVMSAYNAVGGTAMTENVLLSDPLKSEWGFDGVVVSDWSAMHDTTATAHAGQDLEMPGPHGVWGEQLVQAVRDGLVAEPSVDDKLLRVLRLASRVGALAPHPRVQPEGFSEEQSAALLRTGASEGMVLARNSGVLPLDPSSGATVAVIGEPARSARIQGGGSARVFPPHVATALDGIRAAFGESNVQFARGPVDGDALRPVDAEVGTDPQTGEPGLRLRFRDETGNLILDESRRLGDLTWVGDRFLLDVKQIELETHFVAPTAGTYLLGFAGVGYFRFVVDGKVVNDGVFAPEGTDMFSAVFSTPKKAFSFDLEAGQRVHLALEYQPELYPAVPMTRFGLSWDEVPGTREQELEHAVTLAAASDIAVVVVGTTEEDESEGRDRSTLALPNDQDELVRRVVEANPRTIVVVNAGAPVLMPWLDTAAATVLTWFPGQEFGHALADVLTGRCEPGGRVPMTWPAAEADVPVWQVEPVDGRLSYAEGVHAGYREWVRRANLGGPAPAVPFGHGLGYTTWSLSGAQVLPPAGADDGVTVAATVSNTGARAGKYVWQVYLEREGSSVVDRPAVWLAGYATAHVQAGHTAELNVRLDRRRFAHWSVDDHAWQVEPGSYLVTAGTSVADRSVVGRIAL